MKGRPAALGAACLVQSSAAVQGCALQPDTSTCDQLIGTGKSLAEEHVSDIARRVSGVNQLVSSFSFHVAGAFCRKGLWEQANRTSFFGGKLLAARSADHIS